jgi:prepilin-type N-terminal cleavage/methylation domain-containing protein
LNKEDYISGFTLLELIIVLSIISTILLFSIPVFDNIQIFSNSNKEIYKILSIVETLKKEAVQEKENIVMHIDLQEQKIWTSNDASEETAGFDLTQIRIIEVTYNESIQSEQGYQPDDFKVNFSSQGYSDMVLIRLRDEDENDITIIIEPFLLKPKFEEGYATFEDCN